MISPIEKNEIIRKLNEKNAIMPCPRCGNNQFSLVGGYTSEFLQNKPGEVTLGGPSIPAITLVCTKCGFLSQHSLGVLGLLPTQDKNI